MRNIIDWIRRIVQPKEVYKGRRCAWPLGKENLTPEEQAARERRLEYIEKHFEGLPIPDCILSAEEVKERRLQAKANK